MSKNGELREAQANLSKIIASLGPDDEIVQDDRPIAQIIPTPHVRPQLGSCRGMLTIYEEDDEHLRDFRDYMP